MTGTEVIAQLVRRHGARDMARKLGVNHRTIAGLAKGAKPRAALRAKLKEQYSVDPALFSGRKTRGTEAGTPKSSAKYSRKYSEQTPPPAPADPSPTLPLSRPSDGEEKEEVIEEGPLDSRLELGTMVRGLRRELERLNADPLASARERAQVASAVTAAMRLVTRLDGSTTLTMAGIMRSEHWVKLRDGLCSVLAPHPKALTDVSVFLRKLAE